MFTRPVESSAMCKMKVGTGVPLVNAPKRGPRDRDVSPHDTRDMRVSLQTGVTLVTSQAGHTCQILRARAQRKATIARQVKGRRLFAAHEPVGGPSPTPTPAGNPTATPTL